MKKKPLMLTVLSASMLAGVLLATSCKKEAQQSGIRSVSATQVVPSTTTLSGVLGTGHTVKDTILLTSGTAWHLSGLVYVDSLDVLIIQPGTTIFGNLSTGGSTVPGGGLVVTRGAKLLADGTETSPIIFTSANTTNPQSGDWSGVVILGNAPSNTAGRVRVEGIPDNAPADATFGGSTGTDAHDNSGIIRNVRIEYGGFALSPNNEINGLTLAGVGDGTIIDYVEAYKSNDDSFEWFGGTVNCSHLVSVDALDDMFDTDNGYNGTITYALGLSDTTRADFSQSNGFESDNDAAGDFATPNTHPKYNFVTIIGQSSAAKAAATGLAPSGTGLYGRAAHLRRNAEFEISNSIFLGFTYGISIDTALPKGLTPNTWTKYQAGTSKLTNVHTHGYAFQYSTESNFSVFNSFSPVGGATSARAYTSVTNALAASAFNRSSVSNYIPNQSSLNPARGAGAFANGDVTWASRAFVKL
jgi:hypothetical protein